MMYIVQSAHLGKEAAKGLIVCLAKMNGPCPVVAPLNHGAWLWKNTIKNYTQFTLNQDILPMKYKCSHEL